MHGDSELLQGWYEFREQEFGTPTLFLLISTWHATCCHFSGINLAAAAALNRLRQPSASNQPSRHSSELNQAMNQDRISLLGKLAITNHMID
jgi:hypothetical protein